MSNTETVTCCLCGEDIPPGGGYERLFDGELAWAHHECAE